MVKLLGVNDRLTLALTTVSNRCIEIKNGLWSDRQQLVSFLSGNHGLTPILYWTQAFQLYLIKLYPIINLSSTNFTVFIDILAPRFIPKYGKYYPKV